MKRLLFVITFGLVAGTGLGSYRAVKSSGTNIPASSGAQTNTSVIAARITNRSAPFIDGVLEDIWQNGGKVSFPNPAGENGGKFTINTQNYDRVNPSTFTAYFLHDDINLYIAIETTNDSLVESSDYDQNADGLAGLAIERKGDGQSLFRLMWHRENAAPCTLLPAGPPLDKDRMAYDAAWRSSLRGTWNNNNDTDAGYTFEFSIPLSDSASGGNRGLGGYKAGEQMKANIILVDHDSKPGAPFNDPMANFAKFWWGKDNAEDLSLPRWIILSAATPQGEPGDDRSVIARRIVSSAAPVIDGNPDDPIWQQGGRLRFPNSTGKSFTLSQARYNANDPSDYTLYFLHDDTYLYVAAMSDDRQVESADYDQSSDGLISLVFETKEINGMRSDRRYSTYWSKLDQWERHALEKPRRDCDGTEKQDVNLHFQQGPPRYPYDTEHVSWGPTLDGTWNNNGDQDKGYGFEYKIPLRRLGNYVAGESIPANIVLIDHDSNPGGKFDDCATNFKKLWWGFDGNEFYQNGQRRMIPAEEERFVRLDNGVPYSVGGAATDAAAKAIRYLASQQLAYSGLLRSYPDEMAAHTYDNSVALIALTDAGKRSEAQKLAYALINMMETPGSVGFFYDAYNVVDRSVSQGTNSGTGPNTWAAFALAFYGKTYGDRNALDAANRVARWVIERLHDPSDRGVWGGICHPFEERNRDHTGDVTFPFKSTEQVLDAWHLFRILDDKTNADGVRGWLILPGKGWVETDGRVDDPCRQDKRFSTGLSKDAVQDLSLSLDTQSWGAIFAWLVNEFDKAGGAVKAAEKHMRITAIADGRPVTGFGDTCWPKDDIIWYGGTAHMIAAYLYNGDLASASYYLGEMSKVQNSDGSWNHSSANSQDGSHFAKPHIGETAWNYFALRDVNDGQLLPYLIRSGPLASVSAASFSGVELASESIVAAFGADLATTTKSANTSTLPTELAGTTVKIRDSAGVERLSPIFFVAPTQVNYLMPAGTANGMARVTMIGGNSKFSTGAVKIAAVAPGLFTANASGQGVAAGVALRVKADGTQVYEPIARFDLLQNGFIVEPINLDPENEQVFLILFGTGFRSRSALSAVRMTIGGTDVEVLYAGPQGVFAGLDQTNARLPRSLKGRQEMDVVLIVDGKAANTVRIAVK
jgi:uncharacterized protein (TIGR03437 family)